MNRTELVFVVDRSGSMGGMESDTVGGINAVLDEHRKAEGETLVSIVLFDSEIEVIEDRTPIKDLAPLTTDRYRVRGMTALLDAVGTSIKRIRKVHKDMKKKDRPDSVIFVITTDGFENASRTYTYEKVKSMIEKRQEKGWEFLFLGANMDAVSEAARIGIRSNRAESYVSDGAGSRAMYASVANASMAMRAPTCAMGDEWKDAIREDRKSRVTQDRGRVAPEDRRDPAERGERRGRRWGFLRRR